MTEVLCGGRVAPLSHARQIVGAVLFLAGDEASAAASFIGYRNLTSIRRAAVSKRQDPTCVKCLGELNTYLLNRTTLGVRRNIKELAVEAPHPYSSYIEKYICSDVLGDVGKPWESTQRYAGRAYLRTHQDLARRIANILLIREGRGPYQLVRKAAGLAA